MPCQKGGQVGENVRRLTPPGRQYQRFPATAPIDVLKANARNFNIVRFWRLGFCERGARSKIWGQAETEQSQWHRFGIVSQFAQPPLRDRISLIMKKFLLAGALSVAAAVAQPQPANFGPDSLPQPNVAKGTLTKAVLAPGRTTAMRVTACASPWSSTT
ncbi:MAG: hypothetical protein EBY17_08780 [Acidobacteriia bacterium]|nr:hypothetical protein [Terriglobia bacterium]